MAKHVRDAVLSSCIAIFGLWLAPGCKVDDNADVDAGAVDARVSADAPDAPDAASGPCPGGFLFALGYEDWDSTVDNFDGIEFATAAPLDDPDNTAMTAPNGRLNLCLPNAITSLEVTQSDYLDLRFTASPEAAVASGSTTYGLTPTRADDLFSLELGLTRDVQAAYVLVEVINAPAGEPAVGASVSVGNANGGAFVSDGVGGYGAGDQPDSSAFVLFGNVEIGGGTTSVTVSPPPGRTCAGPSAISLVAGAMAATTFVCSDPSAQ